MSMTTLPILPSRNLDQTTSFYADRGFVELGRWPEYLILQRRDLAGTVEIHFWLKKRLRPDRNDVACYLRFDNAAQVQALYDDWAEVPVGGARLSEPMVTDYGMVEFALIDPMGNVVRVGGPVPAEVASATW